MRAPGFAAFGIALMVILPATARAENSALPKDASSWIERRDLCTHWSGEEGYDDARRRQIDAAWKKLGCKGLSAELKKLRVKYAKKPATLKALNEAQAATP